MTASNEAGSNVYYARPDSQDEINSLDLDLKAVSGEDAGFSIFQHPILIGLNTWHADASELSDAVEASGVVLAGHGQTFIDVNFTTWASVPPTTLALEGAFRVDTFPKVLTWISTCG